MDRGKMKHLTLCPCSSGSLIPGIDALLALIVRHQNSLASNNVETHCFGQRRLLVACISAERLGLTTFGALLCRQGLLRLCKARSLVTKLDCSQGR